MIENLYYVYPLLLCTLPVQAIYAQNVSEISLKNYLHSLFIVSLLVITGCSGFYLLSGNINFSLLAWCLNFFALLYANYFYIGIYSSYQRNLTKNKIIFGVIYVFLCLLFTLLLYFCFKDTISFAYTKFLFYFSLVVSLLLFFDTLRIYLEFNNISEKDFEFQKTTVSDTPDIYHIILDTHPGFDVKEFCDEYFREELEKRSFCIYRNFKSNYNCTNLSVSSLLNMEYIQNLIKVPLKAYLPQDVLKYYKNNFVFSFLRNKGYAFNIFANKCFNQFFIKKYTQTGDYVYSYSIDNELLKMMFFSSVISLFINFLKDNFKNEILKPLEKWKRVLACKQKKKKFTFLHFLAPHYPYFVDSQGNEIDSRELCDVKNFLSYTKFIDKEILELIDVIQSNMKKDSIIILHSDHSLGESEHRHNILMAVYYPDDNKGILPEGGTLVNLYRCIFNRYFGTDYELLEDKLYRSNNVDFVVHDDSIGDLT